LILDSVVAETLERISAEAFKAIVIVVDDRTQKIEVIRDDFERAKARFLSFQKVSSFLHEQLL
jgi:hypothetical protein